MISCGLPQSCSIFLRLQCVFCVCVTTCDNMNICFDSSQGHCHSDLNGLIMFNHFSGSRSSRLYFVAWWMLVISKNFNVQQCLGMIVSLIDMAGLQPPTSFVAIFFV